MRTHRVHIWPWLRRPGARVLPNWLAITLGHRIIAWRLMTDAELAHEMAHVRQWEQHGWRFPLLYLAESLRARRSGRRWYHDNRFEVDAREASQGAIG